MKLKEQLEVVSDNQPICVSCGSVIYSGFKKHFAESAWINKKVIYVGLRWFSYEDANQNNCEDADLHIEVEE